MPWSSVKFLSQNFVFLLLQVLFSLMKSTSECLECRHTASHLSDTYLLLGTKNHAIFWDCARRNITKRSRRRGQQFPCQNIWMTSERATRGCAWEFCWPGFHRGYFLSLTQRGELQFHLPAAIGTSLAQAKRTFALWLGSWDLITPETCACIPSRWFVICLLSGNWIKMQVKPPKVRISE